MITLVSGSNRPNNFTRIFTQYAFDLLRTKNKEEVQILDLTGIPPCKLAGMEYSAEGRPEELVRYQERYFIPANKFWFFVPEYNGSIPGILKILLDGLSLKSKKETFQDKKACITGTATGRAGNLRGMDHLADILNHMHVTVMPYKLPISSIHKLIDTDKILVHSDTQQVLEKQANQLLAF